MTSKNKLKVEEVNDNNHKHFKADNEDLKLEIFLDWCKKSGIEIDFDKVRLFLILEFYY